MSTPSSTILALEKTIKFASIAKRRNRNRFIGAVALRAGVSALLGGIAGFAIMKIQGAESFKAASLLSGVTTAGIMAMFNPAKQYVRYISSRQALHNWKQDLAVATGRQEKAIPKDVDQRLGQIIPPAVLLTYALSSIWGSIAGGFIATKGKPITTPTEPTAISSQETITEPKTTAKPQPITVDIPSFS